MGDVRHIKFGITQGFKRLLDLVSSVALAAIAVASLGVTNTVMASIRSRRWHLGVLRSVGLTRGELLRLIVAEALLLGLVAAVLGVTAGLLMSYNANGLSWRIMGYHPPIKIAWDKVLMGVSIIIGVSLAASLAPAIKSAKEEPLALLQTGRAG
jgi:putative ABC transport system permease protein